MSALTAYALGVVALHDKFLASHAPSRFGAVARARIETGRAGPNRKQKKSRGRRGAKRCGCRRGSVQRRPRVRLPPAPRAAQAGRDWRVARGRASGARVASPTGVAVRRARRHSHARAHVAPARPRRRSRPALRLRRRVAPRARDVRGRCSRALVQEIESTLW